MRPSARIPSILAGLALAVGGAVALAPSAQADAKACVNYVALYAPKATDGAKEACDVGAEGDQTSCVSSLEAVGASREAATSACEASR
ncbi:hypothetical protein AB0N09_23820 [Streptomyces erythrochromogenes]|uniref:hypothetical protein n=1 Tax=Streptomyces erythrochromogenes TaxID=285574 RepID=UPI003425D9B0